VKRLTILAILFAAFTAMGAADVTVDGLVENDVNVSYTEQGVNFSTDYMQHQIPMKAFALPDEHHQYLDSFSVGTETQNNDSTEVAYEFAFPDEQSLPDVLQGVNINPNFEVEEGVQDSDNIQNGAIVDGNGNKFMNITVSSHYEHLIFSYILWYPNGTISERFKDVYSAERPQLINIDDTAAHLQPHNEYGTDLGIIGIAPDNRYRESHEVTLIYAYPEDREFYTTDFPTSHERVDPSGPWQRYQEQAAETGADQAIPEDTSGLEFRAYNVTLPADSAERYDIHIKTGNFQPTDMYAFVLGSHGGFEAVGDSHTFSYTGSKDSLTIETDGTYKVELSGAGGGDTYLGSPEYGGYISGNITAAEGDTLDVWVGEGGDTNGRGSTYGKQGGWGYYDGGYGGNGYDNADGGGGGAGSTRLELNGNWVATAAGGGGAAGKSTDYDPGGGGGGGAPGGSGGNGGNAYEAGDDGGGSGDGGDGGDVADTGGGCYCGGLGATAGGQSYDSNYLTLDSQSTGDGNAPGDFDNDVRGESGDITVTLMEKANAAPVIDSQGYNVSDVSYGDTVILEANVTDPDGLVDTVRFTVWENGTKLVDNSTGTEQASGNWTSPSFTIDETDVWYNATVSFAKDDKNATTSAADQGLNQKSVYLDNPPPKISEAKLSINRTAGTETLFFELDDSDQQDIAYWSGFGAEKLFTNSTLNTAVALPLNSIYTVIDFAGVSTTKQVNISNSSSPLRRQSGFDHDLNMQRLNKTVSLQNDGDNISYNISIAKRGTTIQGETWSGTIDNGESVTHTGIWEDDYITNKSYLPRPKSTEITLGFNYTAVGQLYLNNTRDINWPSINTSDGVYRPMWCSQTNQSQVDVSGGMDENVSVELNCSPGDSGTGTSTVVDKGDKDRVWFNISSVDIHSNVTEESRIVRRVDKDDLLNWDERDAKSEQAWADGRKKNISITDSEGTVYIEVGNNHGNSSLHEGSHTMAMSYTYNTGSPSGGGSGGGGAGGGGSGSSDDEEDTTEFDITFDVNDVYTASPGSVSTRSVRINNLLAQELTVEIEALREQFPGCQYVSVQRTLNSNQFEDSGVYTLQSRTQGLDSASYSERIRFQVDLPPMHELENRDGNTTIECGFQVESSRGEAADLLLRVRPEQGVFDRINNAFQDFAGNDLIQYRSICTSLSTLDTDQKTCPENKSTTVPVPTAAALAAVAFLAGPVILGWAVVI